MESLVQVLLQQLRAMLFGLLAALKLTKFARLTIVCWSISQGANDLSAVKKTCPAQQWHFIIRIGEVEKHPFKVHIVST